MTEADIDNLIATADGNTTWGSTMRGAITTLKARLAPGTRIDELAAPNTDVSWASQTISDLSYFTQKATAATFSMIMQEHFDASPVRRIRLGRWTAALWTILPTNDADGSNDFDREFGYNYTLRQWFVEGPLSIVNGVASTDAATVSQADAAQTAAEATAAAALAASSLNDFDGTAVSAPVDVNNQRIVNVADPTFAQNASTKAYTDMRAATFAAVDAKTAPYTLVADDVGKLITTNSDVTIPADATVIPVGSQVAILATAGTPNVLDAAGVTLNGETTGAASLPMTVHQIVVATKIAANTWNVSGV